jgi:hypothetical protein
MRIITTLIILTCSVYSIFAQKMGEIEINKDYTATLNFSDDVELTVVGNNPQIGVENDIPKYKYYGIYQTGKAVILRGNDPLAPKTSITIKLVNGSIWFGTLKYGDNTKIFYDFSGSEDKKVEVKQMKDSLEKKVGETRLSERLKFVMSQDVQYYDLGVDENKMIFQVTNIMNDDKFTYLKIVIQNNSGSNYLVDNMIFKYVEGKKKGFKKSDARIEERINPVVEPDNNSKILKAYSTSELGYVIPLFTVGSSGILSIQMVEKNGTRNPKIEIEAKVMLKVKKMDFM